MSVSKDPLGDEALGRLPRIGDAKRDSVRPGEDAPAMKHGDRVVYVGCAHEQPCPGILRPCSVAVWGRLEVVGFEKDGRLVCQPHGLDGPEGEPELFDAHEVDTPEAVAKHAVAVASTVGGEGGA